MKNIEYNGMQWGSPQSKKPLFVAVSSLSGLKYVVDLSAGPTSVLLSEIVIRDDAPIVRKLGLFPSEKRAMLEAEYADFAFFDSMSGADETVIFKGSENVADILREDDSIMRTGAASYFEGVKSSMKQKNDGSYDVVINIPAVDIPVWLMECRPSTNILFAALNKGPSAEQTRDELKERGLRAIAKLQALSEDPSFQNWLGKRYNIGGLMTCALDEGSEALCETSIEVLRRLCGFHSRSELLVDVEVNDRLDRYIREFYRDQAGLK